MAQAKQNWLWEGRCLQDKEVCYDVEIKNEGREAGDLNKTFTLFPWYGGK